MFDLRLDRVRDWILERGFNTVALQFPEGLKRDAARAADLLTRETGALIIILGDPCYGACDVSKDFREHADALVHFGHSPIPSLDEPDDVLFMEVFVEPDGIPDLQEAVNILGEDIGILSTVQYSRFISIVTTVLEAMGRRVHIGRGDDRIAYPGQVLGCNRSAASEIDDVVDSYLYIGEGDFHPLAVSLGTDKPVVVLNPLDGSVRTLEKERERILRRRFAVMESAREAEDFIILVSSKKGQDRYASALWAKRVLEESGRRAMILFLEEFSPDRLLHYHADAYVNTACPRIALDDQSTYARPMLTLPELEIVLGLSSWDDYRFDCISSPQQR